MTLEEYDRRVVLWVLAGKRCTEVRRRLADSDYRWVLPGLFGFVPATHIKPEIAACFCSECNFLTDDEAESLLICAKELDRRQALMRGER